MSAIETRKVGVKFQSNKFQAFCTFCQWNTGFYNDQEFAYDMLASHTKERGHKTNSASPTRFVV